LRQARLSTAAAITADGASAIMAVHAYQAYGTGYAGVK